MNGDIPSNRKRLNLQRAVLAFVVAVFIYLLVSPTLVRALISSNIAKIRAVSLLGKISFPSGMEELASYSTGDIDSGRCYQGYAAMLVGTNLDIETVASFYQSFFRDWEFSIDNRLASEFPNFHAVSERKTKFSRSIEGISISLCDQECLSRQNYPDEVVLNAAEEYNNFYIITAWYIPFEIRSNLCWCCAGG